MRTSWLQFILTAALLTAMFAVGCPEASIYDHVCLNADYCETMAKEVAASPTPGRQPPLRASAAPDSTGTEPPLDVPESRSDTSAGDSPAEHCWKITFTITAGQNAQEVLLSGTFNDWAETAADADVLTDVDGDGVWKVTRHLEPGKHLYKFVVDGVWQADPTNPNKEKDGFGGYNSVVELDQCD